MQDSEFCAAVVVLAFIEAMYSGLFLHDTIYRATERNALSVLHPRCSFTTCLVLCVQLKPSMCQPAHISAFIQAAKKLDVAASCKVRGAACHRFKRNSTRPHIAVPDCQKQFLTRNPNSRNCQK